jgi:enoyl-CoA hydratase
MTASQNGRSVIVETRGSIRIVSINRPHRRNSVDQATAIELFAVFQEFDRDDTVSIAILFGATCGWLPRMQ